MAPSKNTTHSKTTVFFWKFILFSIIVGLALLLCLEIFSRIVHYQRHGAYPLALQGNITAVKNMLSKARAERNIERTLEELQNLGLQADEEEGLVPAEIKHQLFEALYSAEGTELLKTFRQKYEKAFEELVQETRKVESLLWVLYLPDDKPMLQHNKEFFRELAHKYSVEFIDSTDIFLQYPLDYTTLLPGNGHLSRFGNKLVGKKISEYIDKYSDYRSSITFQQHPGRLGDLLPNQSRIWPEWFEVPYRVITNSQGLRMQYDLTFPKRQQRILILGDSYTFGPHLPNNHCYPNLLDAQYPDKEIVNAGKSGYTITDELRLFMDRAKYAEPDITVLQVLENDISGFFYFMRNQNDRKGRTFVPSSEEIALIQAVIQQ